MRKFLAGAAALAMVATPTLAVAAPTSASALSLRASTPTAKDSKLSGFGTFGLILLAGIIAIPVIAIVKDDDDSDSN